MEIAPRLMHRFAFFMFSWVILILAFGAWAAGFFFSGGRATTPSLPAPNAFYRFESNGTDSAGTFHFPANTNAAFTAGVNGYASSMYPANGIYYQRSTNDVFNFSATYLWEMIFWVKWDVNTIGGYHLLSRWTTGSNEWRFLAVDTNLVFQVALSNSFVTITSTNTPIPVINDAWNMVSVRFDKTNGVLAVSVNNGTEVTRSSLDAVVGTGTLLSLGHDKTLDTLSTLAIDNLAVWTNRNLTPAERTAIYNQGFGREYHTGAWHAP